MDWSEAAERILAKRGVAWAIMEPENDGQSIFYAFARGGRYLTLQGRRDAFGIRSPYQLIGDHLEGALTAYRYPALSEYYLQPQAPADRRAAAMIHTWAVSCRDRLEELFGAELDSILVGLIDGQ